MIRRMNAAIDCQGLGQCDLDGAQQSKAGGMGLCRSRMTHQNHVRLEMSQPLDNLCIGKTIACRIDQIDSKSVL